MSLINQMLKDLDSRRGPSDGAHLAGLQGMGLASVNRVQWQNAFPIAAWLLGGILVLFILLQSLPLIGKFEAAVAPPAEQQAVAHTTHAEPGASPRVETATADTAQQQIVQPRSSGLTPKPASSATVEHKTVTENDATAHTESAAADKAQQ